MQLKRFELSKVHPKKAYTTKVAILRSFLVAASVLLTWFYLQNSSFLDKITFFSSLELRSVEWEKILFG